MKGNDDMQFTVKQLADLLNISKGTVTNYSNQLKLDLKKNSHGVIILSLDQCIKIAEAINENRTELNKVNAERLYKIKSDSEIKMTDELNEKFNTDPDKAEATENNSNNTDQSELVKLLTKQIDDLKQDKQNYERQLQVKDSQIKQLNDTLDEQQQLLHNQQSLQLQSKEKLEALEVELKEVKKDSTKQDTTDVSVNVPAKAEADTSNQNIKNFYSDLKQDRNNKSFISRLFKRL